MTSAKKTVAHFGMLPLLIFTPHPLKGKPSKNQFTSSF